MTQAQAGAVAGTWGSQASLSPTCTRGAPGMYEELTGHQRSSRPTHFTHRERETLGGQGDGAVCSVGGEELCTLLAF